MLEIKLELLKVRRLLKERREADLPTSILYGAQQALGWMIEGLQSPSELQETVERVAEMLEGTDADGR